MRIAPCSAGKRFQEVSQFVLDIALGDAQAGVQLERPRVDARRQREAPAFELVSHAHVEREGEHAERCDREEQRVREIP